LILTGLLLLVLALAGAPLFAIIAASALLGFARGGVDPMVVVGEFFRIADMPVLLAIPLFTFAGYLLSESGAPKRLVRLSNALLSWLPGGLALVTLVTCALFTAFTGASGVTIVAIGALLYPALQQAGYEERFTLGLLTTGGSLGLLFPPSLPLILYGVVAGTNVDRLFLAGVLPGIAMVLLLGVWCVHRGRRIQRPATFSFREAGAALAAAAWELPLPVLVLGGVYSGLFAVSEVAAVTALYVTVVEVGVHREVTWRQLPAVMRESAVLVGGILVILGASLASTNYLIDAQVPEKLFAFVTTHVTSKFTFLVVLNLFLLVLGMILDIFSAVVIVVPLVLPLAAGYGIDPLHLGMIFLANMQIGYSTPPVGMNLFIASYRFGKPVLELYRASLPFVALLLLAVLLITYVPALSLLLVGK
jgi:C4-dicarboxylate transporter DctM subunit